MIPRVYEGIIKEHLTHHRQMLFLSGPRQCGKTTVSLLVKRFLGPVTYLNWDHPDHRTQILKGPSALADLAELHKLSKTSPVIIFDEIHKFGQWKRFLKGFYDTYKDQVRVIVTGSSRLDIYKKGGDSLMGRYFPYRIHPLSVGELAQPTRHARELSPPADITQTKFQNLWKFGGFPEPFLKRNLRFSNRWKALRQTQLFKEDLRELSRIQELSQIEILAEIIRNHASQLVNYHNMAQDIQSSQDSVRRWIQTLNAFYYCFIIRPWAKNVRRSLLKEPKIYLWDWSVIAEEGARYENFVACHLLKAVHFWTDCGLGQYDLWYLRDKEKRKVDFLVTKNQKPWFLVEAKLSQNVGMSKNLYYFQNETHADHAFQVVYDMNYVNQDCFKSKKPIIVPARTFLSQLV